MGISSCSLFGRDNFLITYEGYFHNFSRKKVPAGLPTILNLL